MRRKSLHIHKLQQYRSDLYEQNEWVRGVTTPTPTALLLSDSWCLKSLFYPIWWQLPCLLTHPPIVHFVSPIASAANLINVNSNSIHSSLATLLAFPKINSTCCALLVFSACQFHLMSKRWNAMFPSTSRLGTLHRLTLTLTQVFTFNDVTLQELVL